MAHHILKISGYLLQYDTECSRFSPHVGLTHFSVDYLLLFTVGLL